MTKDETLNFLKSFAGRGRDVFRPEPVSEWLLEEWRAYAARSYPYLRDVCEAIVTGHSLALNEGEEDCLRSLVYLAAQEADRRDELAAGWVVPTAQWLEAHEGQRVEVLGQALCGGETVRLATVKRLAGGLYLIPPRARRRCYRAGEVKVRPRQGTTPPRPSRPPHIRLHA